jgi:hypothetical protein
MAFWDACWHSRQSEADANGDTICMECGETVRGAVLTKALFFEFRERVLRQGSHSMRCVRSDLGWVCADDCPSAAGDAPHSATP